MAQVVVLPEPCSPTSRMATGGCAARSIGSASEPSMATSSSCTILTTIWPGVTDLTTSWPTALAFTLSVNSRTTSSATSASSSARRTSRMASATSLSVSDPRRVSLSRMPDRRSDRDWNIRSPSMRAKRARGRYALAGVDPPASRALPWAGRRLVSTGRRNWPESVRGGPRCQRKRPQPEGRGLSPRLPPNGSYLRKSKAGTLRTLKGAVGSTLKSILKPDLRRVCRPENL